MTYIDSEIKTVSYGFFDGTLGDWLTDASSGGTVTTEAAELGRAVLESGTNTGDYARIEGPALHNRGAHNADVFKLRVAFSVDNGVSADRANIDVGLEQNTDNRIIHQPANDPTSGVGIVVEDGGSVTEVETRYTISSDVLVSELIWDNKRDELIHRYQGCFGNRVTDASVLPSRGQYTPYVSVENVDGTEITVSVYEMEIVYGQRTNYTV